MKAFFIGLLMCFCFLPKAFSAQNYQRSWLLCEDFERTEALYRESKDYTTAYAHCLLARGGEDDKALSLLKSQPEDVVAMNLLAHYTLTGGTFNSYDKNNYDRAYKEFQSLIEGIHATNNYPEGYYFTESSLQTELRAYRTLPKIQGKIYAAGANSLYSSHLLKSPSYNESEDQEKLSEIYGQYMDRSLESLDQLIRDANRCLALPLKSHFKPNYYKEVMKYCSIYKTYGLKLYPLQEKWLNLLKQEDCRKDIKTCEDFQNLDQEINDLIREFGKEIKLVDLTI